MKILKNAPLLTILLIALILLFVSSNKNWGKDRWTRILESDAKGYYAYLPSIFIYHDLNYGFFDKIEKEKYYKSFLFFDYRNIVNNKYINKYFSGTALSQMPFFLIAHFIANLSDFDSDGYSKPYMVAINIAVIFYLLTGLLFLYRMLLLYEIKEKNIAIVLFSLVFGTNIFYYTVGECGMSHVYSFAFVSMFIYYLKLFFKTLSGKHLIINSTLLAIIILIRPVNGLIILIAPFIAQDYKTFTSGIKVLYKNYAKTIPALLLFTGILFIQPIIYKLSSGSFFIYTYGNDRFNFSDPHIMDILFSYKKGLFLYTPLIFFSMLGCYFIYRRSRFEFFSFIIFFLFLTYILSSWWIWWYGGSFSSRVYIEYFPLFGIMLGTLLNNIRISMVYKSVISVIFILIIVCQIQTYQYRYNYIDYENMTKEKYWNEFLRVDKLL